MGVRISLADCQAREHRRGLVTIKSTALTSIVGGGLTIGVLDLAVSAAVRPAFSIGTFVHGLIKHALLVGLPVALITARSERVAAAPA